MEKNISNLDRNIRIVVGLVALGLAYIYSVWWLVIAVIALATAITRKCPAYALLKKKEKPVAKKVTKKKK